MLIEPTSLSGAHVLRIEHHIDERGFFARTWCAHELEQHGLVARIAQSNISFNESAGTLRGMHFQSPPFEEVKIVRCTKGAIFDVIVDIRPMSETYRQWFGIELNETNYDSLYVPKGFAHGFITLQDKTEVAYLMSDFYVPGSDCGYRHDDTAFAIRWPFPIRNLSAKDRNWPDFKDLAC
ncbi:MAG: dTDP-4-dehydrorhamnose 3,5-epimerase [Candidatus Dechloromonas phosphoritropha]